METVPLCEGMTLGQSRDRLVGLLDLQPIQSVLHWSGLLPNDRALFAWCFASHLHASHTVQGREAQKPSLTACSALLHQALHSLL